MACCALANLVHDAKLLRANIDAAVNAGAVEEVLRALERYPASSSLQRAGWSLERMLCSPKGFDAATRAGALNVCLKVMRAQAGDAEVQDVQCGALMNLTDEHEANTAAAVAAGAVATVLAALGKHSMRNSLVVHACGLLSNLFCDERGRADAVAGGAQPVLQAIQNAPPGGSQEAAAAAKDALEALSVKRE